MPLIQPASILLSFQRLKKKGSIEENVKVPIIKKISAIHIQKINFPGETFDDSNSE